MCIPPKRSLSISLYVFSVLVSCISPLLPFLLLLLVCMVVVVSFPSESVWNVIERLFPDTEVFVLACASLNAY